MIITSENITSKQRSKLKSIAATLSPITQIGKGGITDNLLKTLSDALDAREIIKVNILETADDDPKNLAENVAELLEAVPVAVIGRKAIFYRYSRRDNFAHVEGEPFKNKKIALYISYKYQRKRVKVWKTKK